jgi:hypothetical protein
MQVDYLDAAHTFDKEGRLEWLGRLKNWTLTRRFKTARGRRSGSLGGR